MKKGFSMFISVNFDKCTDGTSKSGRNYLSEISDL